ncbi:MAG TPA: glycosyltransferase family 2 protein [Candidatus Uhrbacteria bacterium]|nr:glycosyltransferase family 2 protein [Candidatus Uhrbacteria bacterium]
MSKFSIHLVTWNSQKYIEECLNSVLKQTFTDYLLLIIDNGSFDQTAKIIEDQFLPVLGQKARFIKNKENIGFARAHNQALLWSNSKYVLPLNHDVVLAGNFLEEAGKFLDENPKAGSISGKVLRWQFENSEDLKKSHKSDIIDSLGLKIFKNHRLIEFGGGEKDRGQYDKVQEIWGVSAACPVYRRKALDDVRYKDEFFDNDFFSYKEDVDLAYRLRWRAWSSFYLPQVVAYHDRSAKSAEKTKGLKVISLRENKARFINYHSYKNHIFVLIKNLSPKIFQRYFLHILFYELKKFIYILFFEQSTLPGWKEIFVKIKIMKAKRRFIMKNRLIKDDQIKKWFA